MCYRVSFVLAILCLLAGCEGKVEPSNGFHSESNVREATATDRPEIPREQLELNTEDRLITDDALKRNFFGSFFCDRAHYYVIRDPAVTLHSGVVLSITLFYFDDKLRQTKYVLNEDISMELIERLGTFKITARDDKGRTIVEGKNVLVYSEGGAKLNAELGDFLMKWTMDDREILYDVKKTSRDAFVYYERVKSFDREFKVIQRSCL